LVNVIIGSMLSLKLGPKVTIFRGNLMGYCPANTHFQPMLDLYHNRGVS
jgi:hypothetical protein